MNSWVWLTPFVGAFIGWLTNYVAIKMLFRPREPWYILGFPMQGVMPRRQRDLALTSTGLRVVRVTWKQLVKEPEVVLARLAQSLVLR